MTTPQPSPATMPALPSPSDSVGGSVVAVYARGVEKTPAAIRDALDPAQRSRFEAEYRAALVRAADTLDLEPVLTLVQRTWWVRAVMCLNPEMLHGVAADVNRVTAGDTAVRNGEDR
ncbi:MAG: DUF6247 family protein [Actinobacteria bacterium]|nr:DUF6247 family protein [Actinomycetota bacterium]